MAIRSDERKGRANGDRARRDYRPHGADDRPSLFATLKRTATEFSEDNLTDWAAALTYYGLLALFPALIALVSIIGLFADPQSTTQKVTDIVTQIGPESAAQTFSGPIESITSNRSAAGILFVVGLAIALWSASGYVGAFMRASNIDLRDTRGPAVLEAPPAADARRAGRWSSCSRCWRSRLVAHRPARRSGRRSRSGSATPR